MRASWVALLVSSVAAVATAADVPVGARVLRLGASADPASRSIVFRSVPDPAVAPPFADPTTGASLFVFSSNLPGGCRLAADLPAERWRALRGDPAKGWKYADPAASVAGVRSVVLRASARGGRIVVKARGATVPCALDALAQPLPVEVALRLGADRYCSAVGADAVLRNEPGHLRAKGAPAPLGCAGSDVRAANLNVLHGIFCPAGTASCRLADRVDLLREWVLDRRCPDIVALQEVSRTSPGNDVLTFVESRLVDACPDPYHVAFEPTFAFDESVVLSRYGVLATQVRSLHGFGRYVLHARIDHPIGPLDVFSTHLAAGIDFGNSACDTASLGGVCPVECVDAGAVTVRDCQAVQTAEFVEAVHDVDEPALLMGDFNRTPGSFVYSQFTNRGWIDTQLAAGNAECHAPTGIGCTSGRASEELTDLESPALGVSSRIDFIFVVPPGPASTCAATLDGPGDDDGDGVGTRLFAAEPNPFAPTCGPAPDPMCWVSDHSGVEADVNCD